MSVKFYRNFETATNGTLPSGLSNIGDAAFQVSETDPLVGSKSLVEATSVGADICLITGIATAADQCVQFVTLNSSTGRCDPILRSTVDGLTYYMINLSETGTAFVPFRVIGGSQSSYSPTVTSGSTTTPTLTSDEPYVIAYQIVGSTHSLWAWVLGASVPSGPFCTWTDPGSAITAAGYAGFRVTQNGGQAGVDELIVTDGGFNPTLATTYTLAAPGTPSSNLGVASGNFTATFAAPYEGNLSLGSTVGTDTFATTPTPVATLAGSVTFTVTPLVTIGARTISTVATPALSDPSGVTYTGLNPAATTLTLSTNPSGTMGVNTSLTVTATPNGTATGTATFTPSGSAAAGLSAQVVTFSGGSGAMTASFTPTALGSLTITLTTSTGLTLVGSPITVTVSNLVTCLTAALGVFDTGLAGVVGFRTSTTGSYSGSYTTSTVSESLPGNYQARFLGVPGTIYTVDWYDGTSLHAEDTSVVQAQSGVVTLQDNSITSSKFSLSTVNAAATGILERLMLLIGRFFPLSGGSVTAPKSGNGSIVTKTTGGTTISTQNVSDDGTTQTLGSAS